MSKMKTLAMLILLTSCAPSNVEYCSTSGYVRLDPEAQDRWTHQELVQDANLKDMWVRLCD